MGFLGKLVRHKTVEQLQAEAGTRGDFRRVLGLWQLTATGTGGIIGVPISIPGNTVPVGRVYQYDGANKTMKPVSDWIKIAK
jgi:hypothetical protein